MFGTIAAIAGPVIGGLMSADAAGEAAGQQTRATQQAIDEQRREYDLSRSDLAPYRNVGSSAATRIGQLLGLGSGAPARSLDDIKAELRASGRYTLPGSPGVATQAGGPVSTLSPLMQAIIGVTRGENTSATPAAPMYDENALNAAAQQMFGAQGTGAGSSASPEDIMAMDPGYQFRLNQGSKALTNAAGASGMLNSGATAKALTRYGQDYASNEFGNIYNRLANTAGMGQGAVNTGVNAGASNAGTIGSLLTAGGNARGAAAIGGANALGGAISGIGNYFGQQNTLDKILASRGGQSYTPGYFATYGGT